MYTIAAVTATRAEYGLLSPLLKKIADDNDLDLKLIVTGTHLSKKHGYTINEIHEDGFQIYREFPILDDDNSPYGISITMANALKQSAECFRDIHPDILIILGDRTEMLSIAAAALNEKIPIAHISGGEITEGAVDDCIRHTITKLSYLHFTVTEEYRARVIRMGEHPDRVFNVGALGAENIMHSSLMTSKQIHRELGIPDDTSYVVVTYHPVTLDKENIRESVKALCNAIKFYDNLYFIITKANADAGGDIINNEFECFCLNAPNAVLFDSLGKFRYLSALKHASLCLGNSSSGMLEAPVLGTPTVNIGDRQKGRLLTETIINCGCETNEIISSIDRALKTKHNPTNMYGDGHTSDRIIYIIKDYLFNDRICLKKGFYDVK